MATKFAACLSGRNESRDRVCVDGTSHVIRAVLIQCFWVLLEGHVTKCDVAVEVDCTSTKDSMSVFEHSTNGFVTFFYARWQSNRPDKCWDSIADGVLRANLIHISNCTLNSNCSLPPKKNVSFWSSKICDKTDKSKKIFFWAPKQ